MKYIDEYSTGRSLGRTDNLDRAHSWAKIYCELWALLDKVVSSKSEVWPLHRGIRRREMPSGHKTEMLRLQRRLPNKSLPIFEISCNSVMTAFFRVPWLDIVDHCQAWKPKHYQWLWYPENRHASVPNISYPPFYWITYFLYLSY